MGRITSYNILQRLTTTPMRWARAYVCNRYTYGTWFGVFNDTSEEPRLCPSLKSGSSLLLLSSAGKNKTITTCNRRHDSRARCAAASSRVPLEQVSEEQICLLANPYAGGDRYCSLRLISGHTDSSVRIELNPGPGQLPRDLTNFVSGNCNSCVKQTEVIRLGLRGRGWPVAAVLDVCA